MWRIWSHLLRKSWWKTSSFLYWKRPQVSNFIKKETLAQVISSEFFEISKNTFPYRTPLVTASDRNFLECGNFVEALLKLCVSTKSGHQDSFRFVLVCVTFLLPPGIKGLRLNFVIRFLKVLIYLQHKKAMKNHAN